MASSSGGGMSRETQMSIEASSMFPGFRFSPTDAELISYYLRKKIDGDEKCVEVIPQVEICRHEPWDLPAKSVVQSETEWFFFSSRGRKYPNGSQSKRATQLGYWKATGKERSVRSGSAVIGTKRTLVFHIGRAPRGERTEWIMHEYCTKQNLQDSLVVCRLRKNMDFRGHHGNCDGVISGNNNNNGNGTGMENNGAESSKKTTDSSSDSYSIEQRDGGGGAESSSRMARHDPFELKMLEESCRGIGLSKKNHEDDFYADILKDDIVSLDDDGGLAAPAVSVSAAAAAMQGFAPLWVVPPHQQQGTANRRVKLESRRRVGNVAAAARELEEEAKEKKEREDEVKKREKKKVPSCAVGLVMFVKKKRGKGVAALFVATVLVVAVLLTLFGSLFGHDKVSGKIRKVAHLPSLSFRSGT
ncbi:unnamed protein product [Linum tenue]|uniref:NAC domain-containing protein n=1 Tax=Linum tenue TaxID=586396 RepID=A0AAV0ILR6_9ROSI|nr:unnamed protein product [Linum tenue]